jgi:hypothetical protein
MSNDHQAEALALLDEIVTIAKTVSKVTRAAQNLGPDPIPPPSPAPDTIPASQREVMGKLDKRRKHPK